jgi:hypothetical protein
VTGERVLIADGAHINASGAQGGGEIYVGGGWQGLDPAIKQATATVITGGATLDASATDNGDGGTIVAWSDVSKAESITRVAGTLKARGGANGGNGGRIETSGHGLEVGRAPDVAAPAGQGGHWLIDPYNITVVSGVGNLHINVTSPFTSSGDSAELGIGLIDTALSNGDVTVQTGGGGSQGGDITWDVAYNYAGGNARALTLNAHRDIILNESISSSGSALSMIFNANSDSNSTGGVVVKKDLSTNGGALTFNGLGTLFSGTAAQEINTSGGSISFNGEVLLANPDGLALNSGNGNIKFAGTLNSGNSYSYDATARTWSAARTTYNGGSATGESYLATVTSALESTAVLAAAGGNQAWLGGSDQASEGTWRWVTGPEGQEDNGAGRVFYTSDLATGTTGYTGANNAYVNWNTGEPNDGGGNEDALQMEAGVAGLWSDLPKDGSTSGAIVETNLAASPLTINAGTGTVTFGGAVGASKALGNLTINGTGAVSLQTDTLESAGTIDIDPAVQLDAGSGTTYNINGASIAWHSDVDYNGIGTGSTLSLGADSSITINGSIRDTAMSDDALSIVLNAGSGVTVNGDLHSGKGGNIDIDAVGSVSVYGEVEASGAGNLNVRSTNGGVQLNGGMVQVADGNLTIEANGIVQPINNSWIRSTGAGDINLSSLANSIHIGGSNPGGGIEATGTGNVSLAAMDLGNSEGVLKGNADLRIMTSDAGGSIVVGGAKNTGDGKLNVSSEWLGLVQNGGFNHVIIGRSDGAGAVEVGAASFNQNVTIQTGGNLSVAGALNAGGNTLTLTAGSGATQTGGITAGSLLLSGTGDYTLSGDNNHIGTLAANVNGALAFRGADALTVGSVNGTSGVTATGTIDIATKTNHLTVSQNIATTDASAGALVLNAARDTAAGTNTGGDVILNAGLTVGAGGRATIYTGSLDGSTGVAAAAGGSGSGNFRYGSDETTTNYMAALDTGTYAIYREQPTLFITPGSASSQYGDAPDLSGVTYTVSGFQNGDTGGISGTATYTTGATATANVGTYDIAYNGGLSSALGYAMDNQATSTDEYSVTRRVLNLSGTRTYDGTTALSAGIFTLGNLVNDDTLALSGNGSMGDKDVGDDKVVTLGTLALADGADGDLASNYTLMGGTHTIDISTRTVTVSDITAADKVYDGGTLATVDTSSVSFGDMVEGDSLTVSSTGVFTDKNVGTSKTVNLTNTYGGADIGNYTITDQTRTTAHITRRTVTLSGAFTASDKPYDGTTEATIDASSLTLKNLVAGEDLSLVGMTGAFADKNVNTGIAVTLNAATLADGANGDASNYTLSMAGAPSTTADILRRALTVTALNRSKPQGTADPALLYSAEAQSGNRGLVSGERLVGALARAVGEGLGDYPIGQGTLTQASNDNYDIQFVGGTFTIHSAQEVDTARHTAVQISASDLMSSGSAQSFGMDSLAAASPGDTGSDGMGNLQFVEIRSTDVIAEGDANAEQGGTAHSKSGEGRALKRYQGRHGPATVFVVKGGIRLPENETDGDGT